MKTSGVLLILMVVVVAGVLGLIVATRADSEYPKVGVTDCEVGGSGVRGQDYEYINEHAGITDECKPLRIFNEEVVPVKYRHLLRTE